MKTRGRARQRRLAISVVVVAAWVTVLPSAACARARPAPRDPSRTSSEAAREVVLALPLVRVDRTSYDAVDDSASVHFTVVATLTNRTRDTLWVHPCHQKPPYPAIVGVDRLERLDGEWRPVWGPTCTRALMPDPPRLAPGESRSDTVEVRWYRDPRWITRLPFGPLDGFYRVRYGDVFSR